MVRFRFAVGGWSLPVIEVLRLRVGNDDRMLVPGDQPVWCIADLRDLAERIWRAVFVSPNIRANASTSHQVDFFRTPVASPLACPFRSDCGHPVVNWLGLIWFSCRARGARQI